MKNQFALRHLNCGKSVFAELRKLRNLEVLEVKDISKEVFGELKNVKKLELNKNHPTDYSTLQRIIFPKLESLKLRRVGFKDQETPMEPREFMTLSRSSPNLQHILTMNIDINFIPVVIENFDALKTLHMESYEKIENCFSPAPSRQNLSLEQLVIWKAFCFSPMEPAFDTLNACPNLARIQLHGVSFTVNQVLVLLRSRPLLTHFWFCSPKWKVMSQHNNDQLDPSMTKLINIFRRSQNLVYLSIFGIVEFTPVHTSRLFRELLDDLLVDDADANIVKIISSKVHKKFIMGWTHSTRNFM